MSSDVLQYISDAWDVEGYQKVNANQVKSGLAAVSLVGDIAVPGSRFADIGCGAGEVAAAMAGLGLRVRAIDGSASMVDRCRRICSGLDVEVSQQDANVLDLGQDVFDVVHSSWVLHWLHDIAHAVSTMAGAVAPGGVLVLQWSRAFPLSEGTGLVGVFQDLAASSEWRERFEHVPILSYQYPVEVIADLVRSTGLDVTHVDTELWPKVPVVENPAPELVAAVVDNLRHTGFGRHADELGEKDLATFLEQGVRRAIDLDLTDPRDARLVASRPLS